MIKKYQGIVTLGDECRVGNIPEDGAIIVGGVDVVSDLKETDFSGPVTAALADHRFDGELSIELGWGYSEYTPVDSDLLTVGPHNIIEIVQAYAGQEITLWFADEPVNLLD